MNIHSTAIADFCPDGTTVSLTASDLTGIEKTFHVQTVDGSFRGDLGCWLTTDDSDGDLDHDEFPTFDFSILIEKAENFIRNEIKEQPTDFMINGKSVYFLISSDSVKVVTRNNRFINKDTSSYQREFSEPLFVADDIESARELLTLL